MFSGFMKILSLTGLAVFLAGNVFALPTNPEFFNINTNNLINHVCDQHPQCHKHRKKIRRGPTGPTGDTGDTGPTGHTGPQATQAPQAPQATQAPQAPQARLDRLDRLGQQE